MDRINPEGIKRDELAWALTQRRHVNIARRVDSCMLCRAHRVNEAGLCEVCYSGLDGKELELAGRWLAGVGP